MDDDGSTVYREFSRGKDTKDIASRARDLGLGPIDEAEVDRLLSREIDKRHRQYGEAKPT